MPANINDSIASRAQVSPPPTSYRAAVWRTRSCRSTATATPSSSLCRCRCSRPATICCTSASGQWCWWCPAARATSTSGTVRVNERLWVDHTRYCILLRCVLSLVTMVGTLFRSVSIGLKRTVRVTSTQFSWVFSTIVLILRILVAPSVFSRSTKFAPQIRTVTKLPISENQIAWTAQPNVYECWFY